MGKLSDILTIEKDRMTTDKWNVIHLFNEGAFWHAYEWSAWLIKTVAYPVGELKVTHKQISNSETTCAFVGFRIASLDKFIPNRLNEVHSNSRIDITIELPQKEDGFVSTFEEMQKAFETWKQEQPLKTEDENKNNGGKQQGTSQRVMAPSKLTEIMAQILAWPVEQKTPLECINFISDIKRQLAAII